MDKGYLQHLVDTITDKDNLKKVKEEALKLSRSYSPDEYIQIASELYLSLIHIYLKEYVIAWLTDYTGFHQTTFDEL